MAKKLTIAQKAKLARSKASGTKEVEIRKKPSLLEDISGTPMPASRKAKVLKEAGKVRKIVADQGMSGPYNERIVVKKVDSDAYDVLSNLAKGKALKGAEAEKAIQKAYKAVASRMQNDRNRTASRAEFIARRESNKRSNTNLG
jgi:hypothetical protein